MLFADSGPKALFMHLKGTSLIRNGRPPLAPPSELRYGPTAGAYGLAVSYKRGSPAGLCNSNTVSMHTTPWTSKRIRREFSPKCVQGYLTYKKVPLPLGPRWGPRHIPTSGSEEGAVSYERGFPVERVDAPSTRFPGTLVKIFWSVRYGSPYTLDPTTLNTTPCTLNPTP